MPERLLVKRKIKMGRHKGMSLIELLLGVCIFSMLMTTLFSMLGAVRSIWFASMGRSEEVLDLLVISRRIARELQSSNISSMANCTIANPECPGGAPIAFSFPSAYDANGLFVTNAATGTAVWQKNVVYCVPSGTTQLLRSEESLSSSISERLNNCVAHGKRISSVIALMQMNTDSNRSSATLSVTSRKTNQLGKLEEQSQNITIFVLN